MLHVQKLVRVAGRSAGVDGEGHELHGVGAPDVDTGGPGLRIDIVGEGLVHGGEVSSLLVHEREGEGNLLELEEGVRAK